MSIETMTKLGSYTVGAGGIASYTFSNIPQNYTDLKIIISARDTNANSGNFFANIVMLLNSDTNIQNTGWTLGYSLSGTMSAISSGQSGGYYVIYNPSSSATASTFGNSQTTILNYSSNMYKPISDESQAEGNSLATFLSISTGVWRNTSPVTSLTFTSMTLFAQHSTITLYGVQSMKKAIGNSIKATGGEISFDGTYVYHTFYSTSVFTPDSSLVADCLVIAGGGGAGGIGGLSGGGGGGGVLYSPAYTLNSSIPITVGAGGAGNGSNGTNSIVSNLVAIGGGGGAVNRGGNGTAGGSGGGGGDNPGGANTSGGAGTAGQGNNGGAGVGETPGGGGGAGGAASGGLGGSSTSAYRSWYPAAATVQGGYFAGGGSPEDYSAYNLTNTGFGGNGTRSGGSGIVIIRYKA